MENISVCGWLSILLSLHTHTHTLPVALSNYSFLAAYLALMEERLVGVRMRGAESHRSPHMGVCDWAACSGKPGDPGSCGPRHTTHHWRTKPSAALSPRPLFTTHTHTHIRPHLYPAFALCLCNSALQCLHTRLKSQSSIHTCF